MQNITPASGIAVEQYLKSTVGLKMISKTLDATAVVTVDGDSQPFLQPGTVLAQIDSPVTASGLVGPYLATAEDGRQLTGNIVGINHTFADCSDGDVEVGVLVEGTVKRDSIVFGGDKGDVSADQADLLRNHRMDIKFDK